MKLLVALAFAIVAVAALPDKNAVPLREAFGLTPRIISGEPASLGQFPWQISNKFTTVYGTSFCGGALIKRNWVLTAAHCAKNAFHFEISAGTLESSGEGDNAVTTTSKDGFVHEGYNSITLVNDIALVKLTTEIPLSDNIKLIALGTADIVDDVTLTVSGWGKTSDDSNSVASTLNFVKLTTISNSKCRSVYGSSITEGSLCCVGSPEHSTCNGDSGGPLVQIDAAGNAEHVGVVSFVHRKGCASGNPSGYARTKYFTKWINNIIGNNQ